MARQLYEDKSMVSSPAGGFGYSDATSGNPTIQTQIQAGFVSDPDMFNLTTDMEMIGFNSKNNLDQQSSDTNAAAAAMWKSLLGKPGQHPGASATSSNMNFYHHQQQQQQDQYNINKQDFTSGISETACENLMVGAHESAPWQQENNRLLVDDSSLRCVFPCEANERPSQGLSLSLSSTNPSTISLQSFELRHSTTQTHHHHILLKNSKHLVPTQDLLNEFCSLEEKQSDLVKQKSHNKNKKQWEEDSSTGSSSKKHHSLSSLEFVELHKRKTKLLFMLEEVDRKYRHYRYQMKGVVSSFEAVAGKGAARVYSALALKAMSKHFRSLKDGILEQIEATRKGMGEKDSSVAGGTSRGETPRLKVIDQALRQQKTFQQISMMESHPWRPQRGLPERSVSVLRAWLFEHFFHPYPNDVDKHILARQTGLSRSQVSNWFINARVRLWKPMVEEMYLEEAKEHESNNNIMTSMDISEKIQNPTTPSVTRPDHDEKPTGAGQLLQIDSDSLPSLVNNNPAEQSSNHRKTLQTHMNPQEQPFGSVELDFSGHSSGMGMVHYPTSTSGGGVSLTLGLQQQGHGQSGSSGGVSMAFPAASHGNLLQYPTTRDDQNIEDCQPVVQYSLLDGERSQNLPYRNLMGAQLLHDLAG